MSANLVVGDRVRVVEIGPDIRPGTSDVFPRAGDVGSVTFVEPDEVEAIWVELDGKPAPFGSFTDTPGWPLYTSEVEKIEEQEAA